MKIVSVIPIKLNNERLPGKNTKLLGSKPLIQYIEESILSTKGIDERYVFCSDTSIKQFLLPSFIFLKRPTDLDLPTSNFSQIFEVFSNTIQADVYIYAHATAPFIKSETIEECLNAVLSGTYDSAFTASKIQDYLWYEGQPLNFDARNLPRSQDLNPVYRETSGVYVFTREVFTNFHRRIGERPFIKEVSFREAIDINVPEDFVLAERFLQV